MKPTVSHDPCSHSFKETKSVNNLSEKYMTPSPAEPQMSSKRERGLAESPVGLCQDCRPRGSTVIHLIHCVTLKPSNTWSFILHHRQQNAQFPRFKGRRADVIWMLKILESEPSHKN